MSIANYLDQPTQQAGLPVLRWTRAVVVKGTGDGNPRFRVPESTGEQVPSFLIWLDRPQS